jgi:hypothetical protein
MSDPQGRPGDSRAEGPAEGRESATGPSDPMPGGRACPWCSTVAGPDATACPSCGAALAQRDSIGGLVIPGLTTVDPALQAFDAQPTHLRGPSPSQGMASGVIVAAAAGGPVGLAALGGLAAVAAAEYAGARHGGPSGRVDDLSEVGRPSEIVLQALDRLEHEPEAGTPDGPPTPDAGTEPRPEADASPGADPWRDLPESAP